MNPVIIAIDAIVACVEQQLLPDLQIESVDPHNPVQVHHVSAPWQRLGTGNYAAVFVHPDWPQYVVKVYAPGRPGLSEEAQVYRRLGRHPAFSECFHTGDNYLILKRLYGQTLYDCLSLGISIPEQVIQDVDQALAYAQSRGLHVHDVHGRNVMMLEGRGIVVDVSDFLKDEPCSAWDDLKWAYYSFYAPVLAPLRIKVSPALLNLLRKGYRIFRKLRC